MVHCLLGSRQRGLPSLEDVAARTLMVNRHLLGNIANVPIEAIKPVLALCSPPELARIEDMTWKQGGVDLAVDTWQFWKRHCTTEFGEPNISEVEPLEAKGEDPLPADAGNYRAHYYRQERLLAERRRKTAVRARSLMEKSREEKEKCKAKLIDGCLPRRVPSRYQALNKPGTRTEGFRDKIGLTPKFRAKVVSKSTPPSAEIMRRPVANYQTKKGLNKNLGVQKKAIDKNARTTIAIPRPPVVRSQGWKSSPKAIRSLFSQNKVTSISSPQPQAALLKSSHPQRRPQEKLQTRSKPSLPAKSSEQAVQPIRRIRHPQRPGMDTTATTSKGPVNSSTATRKRAGAPLAASYSKVLRTPCDR